MRALLITSLLLIFSSNANAQELHGSIAGESRSFFESRGFASQDKDAVQPALLVELEATYQSQDRTDQLRFVPYFRMQEEQTYFDVRELYLLHVDGSSEYRAGIAKEFWGVTESHHLVDVINQSDLIEDVDEEAKLGQPMLNINTAGTWGETRLFILPYFRERRFAKVDDRLRPGLEIAEDNSIYEAGSEQWHPDLAVRYRRNIAEWDIGLSDFWGTGREPGFVYDASDPSDPRLRPSYEVIHQQGLDVQHTSGNTLWKLEAISRAGQGKRFYAAVAGLEYTFFNTGASGIDLGLLAEYLYDNRGEQAPPTPFDDDIFTGVRLAFNNVQGSEALFGVISDLHSNTKLLTLEAESRLGDKWKVEMRARLFCNVSNDDALFGYKQDDYLQLRLYRFF